MKILGISGLENSESFKRAAYPGLTEREYRMCQGYDSAAALVVDGKVVAAAAEERFTRQKHTGAFPVEAIRYCLSEARLSLEDVDEIAEDVDEIAEDVDELQEDVSEMSEDDAEDEAREQAQDRTLEEIRGALGALMKDLERLQNRK